MLPTEEKLCRVKFLLLGLEVRWSYNLGGEISMWMYELANLNWKITLQCLMSKKEKKSITLQCLMSKKEKKSICVDPS